MLCHPSLPSRRTIAGSVATGLLRTTGAQCGRVMLQIQCVDPTPHWHIPCTCK